MDATDAAQTLVEAAEFSAEAQLDVEDLHVATNNPETHLDVDPMGAALLDHVATDDVSDERAAEEARPAAERLAEVVLAGLGPAATPVLIPDVVVPSLWQIDMVHLTSRGNARLGEALAALMAPMLFGNLRGGDNGVIDLKKAWRGQRDSDEGPPKEQSGPKDYSEDELSEGVEGRAEVQGTEVQRQSGSSSGEEQTANNPAVCSSPDEERGCAPINTGHGTTFPQETADPRKESPENGVEDDVKVASSTPFSGDSVEEKCAGRRCTSSPPQEEEASSELPLAAARKAKSTELQDGVWCSETASTVTSTKAPTTASKSCKRTTKLANYDAIDVSLLPHTVNSPADPEFDAQRLTQITIHLKGPRNHRRFVTVVSDQFPGSRFLIELMGPKETVLRLKARILNHVVRTANQPGVVQEKVGEFMAAEKKRMNLGLLGSDSSGCVVECEVCHVG